MHILEYEALKPLALSPSADAPAASGEQTLKGSVRAVVKFQVPLSHSLRADDSSTPLKPL
jgi:hypothetical protein